MAHIMPISDFFVPIKSHERPMKDRIGVYGVGLEPIIRIKMEIIENNLS